MGTGLKILRKGPWKDVDDVHGAALCLSVQNGLYTLCHATDQFGSQHAKISSPTLLRAQGASSLTSPRDAVHAH